LLYTDFLLIINNSLALYVFFSGEFSPLSPADLPPFSEADAQASNVSSNRPPSPAESTAQHETFVSIANSAAAQQQRKVASSEFSVNQTTVINANGKTLGTPAKDPAKKTLGILLRASILLAGVFAALLVFLYGLRLFLPADMRPNVGPLSLDVLPGVAPDYVVLLMGVDSNRQAGGAQPENPYIGSRTDTMFLVRPVPQGKTLNVISLPRDTKVYLDSEQSQVAKLNAAHSIGGPEKTQTVLQNSFGVPIHRYIAVDFQAIRAMIDAVGGVDVYVEKRMHYNDFTAKLFINFEKGWHHLDGKQAEAFVRFRHDAYGDIGRIRRQQIFVDALKQKLADPAMLLRLPQLIETIQPYIHTNMNFSELLSFAGYIKGLEAQKIRFATLPGHISDGESTSYWIINPEESKALLTRMLLNQILPPLDETGAPTAKENQLPTVGVFYPPEAGVDKTQLELQLTKAGFSPVCFREKRLALSQLVDHTLQVTDEQMQAMQGASPKLRLKRVSFVGKNIAMNPYTCGSEDVTLIIGQDAFPRK
jgi:LCP family protein required for cell wall assembly